MKRVDRQRLQVGLAIAAGICLLAGCGPRQGPSPVGSSPPAAATATGPAARAGIALTPIIAGDPTLEAACQPPSHEVKAYLNRLDHYCIEYPLAYSLLSVDALPLFHGISIVKLSPEPATPAAEDLELSIQIWPAPAGADPAQAAAQQLAQSGVDPNVPLARSNATIAGRPALVLDGIPGPSPARRAYLLDGDRLIVFALSPWEEGAPGQRQEEAAALWERVTSSFRYTVGGR
jgi:hypothetical protein